MLVSGQRCRNNWFPKKYGPKNRLKIAKVQRNEILNAKEYGLFRPGYQGHWTLFLCVNKQILNQQALNFKSQ